MKRPPGKRTGRHERIRFTDVRGRRSVHCDRGVYLVSRGWLQRVIAGTGKDFEWQVRHDGPWHPVEATVQEAIDWLRGGGDDRLGVRRRAVERCLRIRERRLARGLVVYGDHDG